MSSLIHLIYASAAIHRFDDEELMALLEIAREKNRNLGITGMLLYCEGSFFQVLEGQKAVVEELFSVIVRDQRHAKITKIIQEPIPKRSFGEWSMAFTGATPNQLREIDGLNDFFEEGTYLADIDRGRAKKLLYAFSIGRWRQFLKEKGKETSVTQKISSSSPSSHYSPKYVWNQMHYSFAFQPIVDTETRRVNAYEALIRGKQSETPGYIFSQIMQADMNNFVKQLNIDAIFLAAKLGIDCSINLNFLPSGLQTSGGFVREPLEAAKQLGVSADQIVIEITEKEAIDHSDKFTRLINEYRSLGVKVAIDDFGAGYSGLNLLANFQPDIVKLDMQLIRDIDSHGPRQAIVHAVSQVCFDLGIDLIAEGVENPKEYFWLKSHGVVLFQGYLFAKPGFESLPDVYYPD